MLSTECLIFLLCAASASISQTDWDLEDKIYVEVSSASYEEAIATAQELISNNKSTVVRDAVKLLMHNKVRNSMEFAYKLWQSGNSEIVRKQFPVAFETILGGDYVNFIDYEYGKALKLGYKTDRNAERTAYGDKYERISNIVAWRLLPFWEDGRLFFKILNKEYNEYLKLDTITNHAGDHRASAGSSPSDAAYHWYLHPVDFLDQTLFFVYNRQYRQALKLSRQTGLDGGYNVFGHNGDAINDLDIHAWSVSSL
ncbi:low molecular mass lipoprotein 4-like [Bombyx mori]|uniref:Uncharacterized protein n=1 Tax=Bombyx mori TaxID=7091 RepID=A0A8R2DMW9_BOMMO|nr:low molecular 30 kDa lipoprotein PBMHP-12-like [Bombyx mori]XP_021207157.1 low molecular 30 kDa lipoprotein PBMHP-12-like [Bombyx mori]